MLKRRVSHFESATMFRSSKRGFNVSIEEVPYEFQRGGKKTMRILRTTDG